MSPHIFLLLLEGKANFKGCGTVTMPSAEAIAQADPDIIQCFQAIRKVDLSGMTNLAGELARICMGGEWGFLTVKILKILP